MTSPIEEMIFDRIAASDRSIAPEDVAKALDPEGWRRVLPKVRAEAVGLARAGRIVILRHNKPADPDTFKGVWRMRLPQPGDVAPAPEPTGEED